MIITGAAGNVGSAIIGALKDDYRVVGLDLPDKQADCETVAVDLTDPRSVEQALKTIADRHGREIAAVIHLAAYFDFTGEKKPLYDKINVGGTRNLLAALQAYAVERFIYAGTMLVHRPGKPGERIDETQPIEPKWAYPTSKAETEAVIRQERGSIPVLLLHIAGLYDERSLIPTLAHQVAHLYERDIKSYVYPGDLEAGQSVVHKEDLAAAFRQAVDKRNELPEEAVILIGEPEVMSYGALQRRLGQLIHGEQDWPTLRLPKALASAGAWAEAALEPVIPDALDQGEEPFERPFLVAMADDHYEIDIGRARRLLGWEPRHRLADRLPGIVESLKRDPLGWYKANRVTPPPWLLEAQEEATDVEALRRQGEQRYRGTHERNLWAPFLNMAMGTWLITAPPLLGYQSTALAWSDIASGVLVLLLSTLTLSWRFAPLRWAVAAIALWVMLAPLVFWTTSAAAYANDTLVGAIVLSLAVVVRPVPGVALVARETGPTIPPGWEFSPSSWHQRLAIIALAFVGLYVSRYLAAYQLGHSDSAWDPFFSGGPQAPDPTMNGTEVVITSAVSEAFPIPDAGLGAFAYLLEILTGVIGSSRRWRTMPWLVLLFGILIVPLGVVSIGFIIIQPIFIGTWCFLCLVQAAAMLAQIPYSLDELVATGQFLARRKRAGRPLLRVLIFGDTDEGGPQRDEGDSFALPPGTILGRVLGSGISWSWELGVSLAIGLWLLFTRSTLGNAGTLADMDHLLGSLILTVAVTALADVAKIVRYLNVPLGAALVVTPFAFGADSLATVISVGLGLLLIWVSLRPVTVTVRYGDWNRFIR
ncbi:MAG TPA: vitamin K epoxide reductase family protein [Kiloniellales bacterium]|nr:vitamin K epoxide reductase family protein [Kiloniellales bacterium]